MRADTAPEAPTAPRRSPSELLAAAPVRSVLVPAVIFLAARLVGGLLLAAASPHQGAIAVPTMTAGTQTVVPADPGFSAMLMNWDGQWYAAVASRGYPSELPRVDGEVQQNTWAFYPAFPAVVRALMAVSHLPFPLAASLVSILCGVATVVLLHRWLERTAGVFTATLAVLALSLHPAAVVLQTAYADSLALLAVVLCLRLLAARQYWWLLPCVLLLSLTRPVVLPLAVVMAAHAFLRWRRRDSDPLTRREVVAQVVVTSAAVASVAIWPAVAWAVTGERNAFFETRDAWRPNNDVSDVGWLPGLFAGQAGPGLVALLVIGVSVWVATRVRSTTWPLELRVWPVVYTVYVLASTRPSVSLVRYLLLGVLPLWPVAQRSPHPVPRSTWLLAVGSVVVLGLAGQAWWVRELYVMRLGGLGAP